MPDPSPTAPDGWQASSTGSLPAKSLPPASQPAGSGIQDNIVYYIGSLEVIIATVDV